MTQGTAGLSAPRARCGWRTNGMVCSLDPGHGGQHRYRPSSPLASPPLSGSGAKGQGPFMRIGMSLLPSTDCRPDCRCDLCTDWPWVPPEKR